MYAALLALAEKLKHLPEVSEISELGTQLTHLTAVSQGTMGQSEKALYEEQMKKLFAKILSMRDNMILKSELEEAMSSS